MSERVQSHLNGLYHQQVLVVSEQELIALISKNQHYKFILASRLKTHSGWIFWFAKIYRNENLYIANLLKKLLKRRSKESGKFAFYIKSNLFCDFYKAIELLGSVFYKEVITNTTNQIL